MANEVGKNPQQQQGPNTSKPDPSQGNQSQNNPQDISKKNPSQDSNPQHKDQPQKQAV